MKNYIEKLGIDTDIIYQSPSGAVVTITSPEPIEINGQQLIRCTTDGHDCYTAYTEQLQQLIARRQQEIEDTFLKRYPGIDKLLDIIRLNANYTNNIKNMMEDDYGVNCPITPSMSIADAREKWPIAAAYMDIVNAAMADPSSNAGYNRRLAGDNAIARLLKGEDVIKVRDDLKLSLKK